MATLRVVYDVDGWAYHRCASALAKYAPPDFQVTIAPLAGAAAMDEVLGDDAPDLVFLLEYFSASAMRAALERRGWPSRLLTAFSSGWPRGLPAFFQAYRASDALLVSNPEYRERTGCLPHTYTIPYGVDPEVFRVRTPIRDRRAKVLWTGSLLHRGVKGYDDYVAPLARELRRRFGIPSELLLVDSFGEAKRSPSEMADWYDAGTVLVCASESEGTPNPPLEAAASGCTVVSTPVGNMPALIRHGLNGYLVDRTLESLVWGVRQAVHEYRALAARMQEDIRPWLWPARSPEFFRMFRDVIAGPPRGATASRPDLSPFVTVFVTTVGAPEYETCRDLLARQDCGFTLRVLDRVTPITAALQRMVDECTTPFYVQVDEDMLLYPHAIRALYERMRAAAPEVAVVVGNLHDVHLDRPIEGVKLSRHAVARRYPWAAFASVVERNRRLQADGHRIDRVPDGDPTVYGLHGTEWTPMSLYERYRTLERLRRRAPGELAWFAGYPRVLLDRFLGEPTELNFFALVGALSGVLTAADGRPVVRDARRDGRPPGFEEVSSVWRRLSGEARPDRDP